MNYDEKKPGRELDAEVAKKVMGIDLTGARPDLPIRGIGCAPYSTDIAAAWEVVEKLTADEHARSFSLSYSYEWAQWTATFMGLSTKKSAPHAICLAALKATET